MRQVIRERVFQVVFLLIVMVFVGLAFKNSYRANQIVYAQAIPWPEPPYVKTNVSFSTSGAQTLVAAQSAGATCVYGLLLINAGASPTTINIYEDGGTTSRASVYLASGGGAASFSLLSNNPKNPYFITNTTTAFVVNSSAAVQVNGTVYAAQCP